ncbi:GntR family transcriptional regulator [Xanthobacter sp. V4C-4]|uniref:GntR family transcriptional regulator n=1 Tax=Xanthobacter cornucopiae TaxID=3119924 RepID=UPI0037277E6D
MEQISSPKRLVEQTYDVILDAICDGTLEPGERLTQEDIAARLKVSRQPVTHALVILKAQGFVIEAGKRGVQVAPIQPDLLKAIYELRSAVEPLAAELATANLKPEHIRRGRDLIARGRNLVLAGDSKGVVQADMDFHSFIYELSGNPLIVETMRLNWQHLRRGMGRILSYPGLSIRVWREHEEILEAMLAKDAKRAAQLMHVHLLGAYKRVVLNEDPASPQPAPQG